MQQRNPHNLLQDFQDEVPGYVANGQIAQLLGSLSLETGTEAVGANLLRCYDAMIQHGILPKTERLLVKAWLKDLKQVTATGRTPGRAVSSPASRVRAAGNPDPTPTVPDFRIP